VKHIIIVVFFLLSLACVTSSWSQENNFDKGVEAFQAEDYSTAVEFFLLSLEQDSYNEGALLNIGISYFKLGEYEKANEYLRDLFLDGNFDPVVIYTLAVTEKRLGNIENAIELFEEVTELGSDDLADAAYQQIELLLESQGFDGLEDESPKKWWTNFNIGFGYDDGVISLLDDIVVSGDEYIDLTLSTVWQSDPTSQNHWFLSGIGYTTQFSDITDFSVVLLGFGLGRSQKIGEGVFRLQGDYENSTVGGDDYLQALSVGFRYTQTFGNTTWTLRYRAKNMWAYDNSAYDHLAGTSHQFSTSFRIAPSSLDRFQIQYDFNINSRGETDVGLGTYRNYTSLSLNQHSIVGIWERMLPNSFYLTTNLSYRAADYDDDYIVDGVTSSRGDGRFSVFAELSKDLNESWEIALVYEYSKNGSTIEQYEYGQNTFFIQSNWTF
jgi:hypothetical protein